MGRNQGIPVKGNNSRDDVFSKGEVCNMCKLCKLYYIQFRPKSRSIQLPVTVQGSKSKLWGSRPLAVKVTSKYYISINNGIFHWAFGAL